MFFPCSGSCCIVMSMRPHRPPWCQDADAGYGTDGTSSLCCCVHQLQLHAATSSVCIGQKLILSHQAEIAQLVARRSRNPKVVSSILTFRMAWRCLVSYALARAVDHCRLGPGPSAFQTDTSRLKPSWPRVSWWLRVSQHSRNQQI